MEISFFCFVFLFHICGSNSVAYVWGNHWPRFLHNDYNGGYINPYSYGEDGLTQLNHHDTIMRPCPKNDKNCIRKVFAAIFQCLPTNGPVPDPYTLDTLNIDIPHSNLTFTYNNAKVTGLNGGKINEFYINKVTGRVVLEVIFDRIMVDSPTSVVNHHRKGMEPIEKSDFSSIEFKSLSLTLTVSDVGEELWKTHVYSYLSNSHTPYRFGLGITQSKDRVVTNNNKKLIGDMALSVKEAFLTQGPLFMSIYLQNSICDFRHIPH